MKGGRPGSPYALSYSLVSKWGLDQAIISTICTVTLCLLKTKQGRSHSHDLNFILRGLCWTEWVEDYMRCWHGPVTAVCIEASFTFRDWRLPLHNKNIGATKCVAGNQLFRALSLCESSSRNMQNVFQREGKALAPKKNGSCVQSVL